MINPLVPKQRAQCFSNFNVLGIPPRSLLKYSLLGLIPRDSDSVDLGWGPEICFSSKLSVDADVAWSWTLEVISKHLVCCGGVPLTLGASWPTGCINTRSSCSCSAWGAAGPAQTREAGRVGTVAGQRGGEGPGAWGRGLAPGGGAQRPGLPLPALGGSGGGGGRG